MRSRRIDTILLAAVAVLIIAIAAIVVFD